MSRDDFSQNTKMIIAKRVGFMCSFPCCGKITYSAHSSDSAKAISTGMACHISSASGGIGSIRYDSNMTSEERSSPENGIWMCYRHGKMVDTDESRFSINILKHWKKLAEEICTLMHEEGYDFKTAQNALSYSSLASQSIRITSTVNDNSIIGDALLDSCVDISWGEENCHIIRDFLIEYSRNAIKHGKASAVQIKISMDKVTISDNGKESNPRDMLKIQRNSGGVLAMKALVNKCKEGLITSSWYKDRENITTIALLNKNMELKTITPCTIDISPLITSRDTFECTIDDTCKEIYVILPRYFCMSDLYILGVDELSKLSQDRPVIFVGECLSQTVIQLIQNSFPNSQVINQH